MTDFAVGDRVAARVRHASESVVDAQLCTLVPDDVSLADACWFALAKIALMGAREAGYELGGTVAVIGAGPIGQMSVRWAVAAGGSPVVVVDPVASRLELAQLGGAATGVAGGIDETRSAVIQACENTRPGVVVDTTGNAAVFAAALQLVGDRGRVVLLGDTGFPHQQHLTPDVLIRGLTVVGAHDTHSPWDQDRPLHELFFRLVRSGRFSLEGLITHRLTPEECQEAYELATSRQDVLGVLFEWPT